MELIGIDGFPILASNLIALRPTTKWNVRKCMLTYERTTLRPTAFAATVTNNHKLAELKTTNPRMKKRIILAWTPSVSSSSSPYLAALAGGNSLVIIFRRRRERKKNRPKP